MNAKPLVYLFCIDLLAELLAIIFKLEAIRIITKPLLMILLFSYVALNSVEPKKVKHLLLAALAFSWLGDLFLLFEKNTPIFFIAGLLSFLTAHIFYILMLLRIRNHLNPDSRLNKPAVLFLLIYVALLFFLLYPNLGVLKVPVILYALVLGAMFIASMYAATFSKRWQKYLILGALLFVVSDSILAFNKFYTTFPAGSFLVMLTYGLAQLFIVLGVTNSLSSAE